jgi:hypothetical protein
MDTTGPHPAWKRGAMMAAPILLIVFSVLHGGDELVSRGIPDHDEWVRYVSTIQGRWLLLHLVGLGLFPLLGLVTWWMLPPRGTASRVSRAALAVYIILYPAYDALVGIGASVLLRYRQALPAADQAVLDPVIKGLFFDYSGVPYVLGATASTVWGIGAVAAAVAVWREAGWRVGLPLAGAGLVLGADHSAPFGAVAGLLLGLAVWPFLTREHRHAAPALTEAAPV